MVYAHSGACTNEKPCDRCAGIRRHPQPHECDWCHTIHTGDANNCPEMVSQYEEKLGLGFTEDPVADYVLDWIKTLTKNIKEKNMIRAPQDGGQQQQTSGGGRRRQRTGYRYITNDDLSLSNKKLVKIRNIKENDTNSGEGRQKYSDYILQVTMDGEIMLYGLRITHPVFKALYNEFGPDENNWPGNSFYLFLEADEFSGQHRQRCEFLEKKENKKR